MIPNFEVKIASEMASVNVSVEAEALEALPDVLRETIRTLADMTLTVDDVIIERAREKAWNHYLRTGKYK